MPNRSQRALAAGNIDRIQGVSTEQTVTSEETLVHTVAANLPGGSGNAPADVVIQNGGTTVYTMQLSAGQNEQIPLNAIFENGLRINPSTADAEIIVTYSD